MKFIFFPIMLLCFFSSSLEAKDVKIAFFKQKFKTYRGVDVALYDYAHFNETILGNLSYIFTLEESIPGKEEYFKARFGERCFFRKTVEELENILLEEGIEIVYSIKSGERDGFIFNNAKNAVHVVFNPTQPHGDVYAVISPWLLKKFKKNLPVVPHMIHLHETSESLRGELNIPQDAIVFGRHGGSDTFDIKFAQRAVVQTVLNHKNIYFCFLNTDPFFKHERIIYLPATADLEFKRKFINTCDAMLHARSDGETFGLACGEFSLLNKPVITCTCGDKAHIQILGNKGIYYSGYNDLMKILSEFRPSKGKDYNAYQQYTPEKVMKTFEKVFITPLQR